MLTELLGLVKPRMQSRATIENPSVSLSDPDAWAEMFGEGSRSSAGVMVSHSGSLGLAAVWQAVSMISGDAAKMPLNCYKRDGDAREKDKLHPAQKVVRRKANREKSAFDFWRTLLVHCCLWNNGYAYIARNGRGDVMELINLLPDRTSPERDGGVLSYLTETEKPDGTPWVRSIPAADVLHVRGISIDGLRGCDLVMKARDSWGLALAAEKFSARFFKHGVRAGGILELPPGMSAKSRDNVKEGFERYHEGEENWFKTVILRDGAKFHNVSVTPEAGQLIESREEQVREVSRWFNLPPSRLGLSDSVSYSSKAEDNQNYLETTLSPWLTAITSECNIKLLSGQQQTSDSHFFEHNTNAILATKPIDRYQVYALGLRNRILTRNECRAFENLNPVEGGDDFDEFAGGGMDPGGGADNVPPDGSGNTKDIPDDGEETDEDRALRRVVYRMTDHARKKSEKPNALIEWVDGGLTAHRQFSVETIGDDIVVQDFASRLKRLCEVTKAADLLGAVDYLCSEFET